MDDFNLSTLTESRNEYSALFVTKLAPCIVQGITSIFNEACELCIQNEEDEKYLMTFQNLLGRVTRWNGEIIQRETDRIINESNCNYLEDLLTCVHVTQLKILTNVRVGTEQKKVTIDIPKLESFIHKCYIEVARKVYKNVFLYDRSTTPLSRQKNMREMELITKECILNVIRNNMPIEEILKSYLEEGNEDVTDEEKTEIKEVEEEVIEEKPKHVIPPVETTGPVDYEGTMKSADTPPSPLKSNLPNLDNPLKSPAGIVKRNTLGFNDTDVIVNYDTKGISGEISNTLVTPVSAPKDISRLEQISEQRNKERKEGDESDDDDDGGDNFGQSLKIFDDSNIKLDIEKIEPKGIKLKDDLLIDDIEVLA